MNEAEALALIGDRRVGPQRLAPAKGRLRRTVALLDRACVVALRERGLFAGVMLGTIRCETGGELVARRSGKNRRAA
jgi:hypothetical protein